MAACSTLAEDILHGAKEIATFIGEDERRTRWLCETRKIPVFLVGGRLRARRSTLLRHYAELEAEALAK